MQKHSVGLLTSLAVSVMCLLEQRTLDRLFSIGDRYDIANISASVMTVAESRRVVPPVCFHNADEALFLSLKGSGLHHRIEPPPPGFMIVIVRGEYEGSCGFECTPPDIKVPDADWRL
jgi:hypothetical protein